MVKDLAVNVKHQLQNDIKINAQRKNKEYEFSKQNIIKIFLDILTKVRSKLLISIVKTILRSKSVFYFNFNYMYVVNKVMEKNWNEFNQI